MNRPPLRTLLLPAVLVSSAVFVTLTLPFAILRPRPIYVQFPPFFEGEVKSAFESGDKSLVIRYIGFAIATSVGAGVTTIEVSRRVQSQRARSMSHPVEVGTVLNGAPDLSFTETTLENAISAIPLGDSASGDGSTDCYVLDAPEHYRTCRIALPDRERRFFAIAFQGECYSLFRSAKPEEDAIRIAERLHQQGRKVILTYTDRGYAVWLWEPDAQAIAA